MQGSKEDYPLYQQESCLEKPRRGTEAFNIAQGSWCSSLVNPMVSGIIAELNQLSLFARDSISLLQPQRNIVPGEGGSFFTPTKAH